jgi:hypothetical protein
MGGQPGVDTSRIITAGFETLRDRGYAETSARAIAEVGGFNQAQIFCSHHARHQVS